jgi:chromosome partitioning protein
LHIVSIINYKGGVGKTTLTANLGAELAFRGRTVLMLDLDAQASLTFSFIKPDYWQNHLAADRTIKAWFDSFETGSARPLAELIMTPSAANATIANGRMDLIPSHLGLINVDLELATELGGATLKQSKRNYLRVHRRLADGLAELDKEYDIVLIDCPPNFNVVTKTAIVAAENVLIPAKPDYLSTLGIDYLQRSLAQLVEEYNEYVELDPSETAAIDPAVMGVVFTMVSFYGGQPISAMRPFIAQTKKLGVPVFETMIRENKTLFGDAPQYGVPVVLTRQPTGTYGEIVDELESLAAEFVRKLS